MRKLTALFALTIFLAGCTAFPEKKNPGWGAATQSERLNELFWDDVANQRWSSVKEHVAPLAVMTEGETKYSGADAIVERLKAEGITAAQAGEVESQPAGADLVTTYVVSTGGKSPRRVLAVWQPTSKRWVLTAMSVTVTTQ